MIIVILVLLLAVACFFDSIQKLFFKNRGPLLEEVWSEMESADWFQKMIANPEVKAWILSDKENGLLQDPYYVRKIIDNEVYREGFIRYISNKTKMDV